MSIKSAVLKSSIGSLRRRHLIAVAAVVVTGGWLMRPLPAQAAACALSNNLGTITTKANIPAAGKYKIWSRIRPADTTNNAFYLEIDGNTCFKVGDNSALPANVWTWVNYSQTGTTKTTILQQLTAGDHNLKLMGNEVGVGIDRIIFLGDSDNCTPNNTIPSGGQPGDNCKVASSVQPPAVPAAPAAPTIKTTTGQTVSVAKPSAATTSQPTSVSGPLVIDSSIVTDANKQKTITKVEYYVDAKLVQTLTKPPFFFDTTKIANGTYDILEKIYFNDGTTSEKHSRVTVNNSKDSQAAQTKIYKRPTFFVLLGCAAVAATLASAAGILIYRFYKYRPLSKKVALAHGEVIVPKDQIHK